jgi:hypothetical protein
LAGKLLRDDEFVLSTDEKTSIQARVRIHPALPPQPGEPMRVEHEYVRCGAWAYLAALDVHRAKVFGRCEHKTGIAPFERLVDNVMHQPPYNPSSPGLLDHGQWLLASWGALRCPTPGEISTTGSRAWSRSCELGGSNPAPYPIEPLKAAQVERLAGLIRQKGRSVQ